MKPAPPNSPTASRKTKPHTGVTRYDPEFAVLICERIATSTQSLLKICEAPDMPGIATIFRWVREHPEFQEMYVLAKETQAEVLLEEALDIVDDDSQDIIESADGKIVFNRIHLQRCKMQVAHRRWIAAKLLPRKYGTHQREKSPATPPSPSPAPAESSGPCDDRPPGGIITEEYRMKLIAARRKIMDEQVAAAAAEAAAKKSGSPSPNPDLQSHSSGPQPSTSRPPGSDPHPAPPLPAGSPTGHNPRPMYDVPTPRRELSVMNKACS